MTAADPGARGRAAAGEAEVPAAAVAAGLGAAAAAVVADPAARCRPISKSCCGVARIGVVLRFGAYTRTTQPGLNYHLPTPIESVLTPSVTRVNRTEIGYRSGESRTSGGARPEEALMLTGDENIIDINFTVFWVIKNAQDYLFHIRNPEATVKSAAESAIREIVGETPIAQALAEGRGKIETDTTHLLQRILDSYGAGIVITQVQMAKVDPPAPVIESFRDVQRALADKERLRNEAEAYRNDILPKARGQAQQMVLEAEGYRQEVINRAQGEASRFSAVYNEYKQSRDITRKRMYLETMEDILQGMSKIIVDKSGSGVVPKKAGGCSAAIAHSRERYCGSSRSSTAR